MGKSDIKYTAFVKLPEEKRKSVCRYLCEDIDLADYPASYDPFNGPDSETLVTSSPTQTSIVSVTANGKTHTVACREIAIGSYYGGYCEEARAFLKAVSDTVGLLTSLPEWEAFPEYERVYD